MRALQSVKRNIRKWYASVPVRLLATSLFQEKIKAMEAILQRIESGRTELFSDLVHEINNCINLSKKLQISSTALANAVRVGGVS